MRASKAGSLTGTRLAAALLALLTSVIAAPRSYAYDWGEFATTDPTAPWTGFYVGAHLGYSWSNVDWHFNLAPRGESGEQDSNSFIGGAHIGYSRQFDWYLLGIEVDASGLSGESSAFCPSPFIRCSHSLDWLASVRPRAGVIGEDKVSLFYVTGGVAFTSVDFAATSATGTVTRGFTANNVGWVAGVGAERVLHPNVTARVEFLYYDFGDATARAGIFGVGAEHAGITAGEVRLGLNWCF
jgi:outer membrane immunogenic protein